MRIDRGTPSLTLLAARSSTAGGRPCRRLACGRERGGRDDEYLTQLIRNVGDERTGFLLRLNSDSDRRARLC